VAAHRLFAVVGDRRESETIRQIALPQRRNVPP
jgi:hypothetical protein